MSVWGPPHDIPLWTVPYADPVDTLPRDCGLPAYVRVPYAHYAGDRRAYWACLASPRGRLTELRDGDRVEWTRGRWTLGGVEIVGLAAQ